MSLRRNRQDGFPKSFKMNHENFDFSIWERHLARKEEQREELRHSVLLKLDKSLKVLSEKYSWKEIFIFGSITRNGAFHYNSDIDIGIEGLDPLKHYAFVGEISGLMERDVDVVILEECGFTEMIKEKGLIWSMKTS
jgi:uncharacterized protein